MKSEDEDWQAARLELNNTEVEIIASENKLVRVIIGEETVTSILVFYPDEAEKLAHGLLKAVEHIKANELDT